MAKKNKIMTYAEDKKRSIRTYAEDKNTSVESKKERMERFKADLQGRLYRAKQEKEAERQRQAMIPFSKDDLVENSRMIKSARGSMLHKLDNAQKEAERKYYNSSRFTEDMKENIPEITRQAAGRQRLYQGMINSIKSKNPWERYQGMDDDEKSTPLSPSNSKLLRDITSMDNVQKYISATPYDLDAEEAKLQELKDKRQQAYDLGEALKMQMYRQPKRTEEELDSLRREEMDVEDRLARLQYMDDNGLTYNNGDEEITIKKRPDDYDERTRDEYDIYLYDAIYGKGSYDQRMYANTDSKADCADSNTKSRNKRQSCSSHR